MRKQKEFYFLRHGKTAFNNTIQKIDHDNISLSDAGILEVQMIQSTIQSLPIKSICYSPLKRAVETKEILFKNTRLPSYEVAELGESSTLIWDDMTSNIDGIFPPHVEKFMQQTMVGIERVLSYKSPSIMISHGGIHWAICLLLNVQNYDKFAKNAAPGYFYMDEKDNWHAESMI